VVVPDRGTLDATDVPITPMIARLRMSCGTPSMSIDSTPVRRLA
jgi:hypothetical protein